MPLDKNFLSLIGHSEFGKSSFQPYPLAVDP